MCRDTYGNMASGVLSNVLFPKLTRGCAARMPPGAGEVGLLKRGLALFLKGLGLPGSAAECVAHMGQSGGVRARSVLEQYRRQNSRRRLLK